MDLKRNLPTKGLLAHQLQCLKCGHKSTIRFEMFHSISLAIPNSKRLGEEINLKDCLNAFVSNELIKDAVCENCQKLENQRTSKDDESSNSRKTKSTFTKRLTFAKLPQLLVIHFQRLVWNPYGHLIKKRDFIRFPHILSMDDYEYYVIQQQQLKEQLKKQQQSTNILNGNLSHSKGSKLSINQSLNNLVDENDEKNLENLEISNNSKDEKEDSKESTEVSKDKSTNKDANLNDSKSSNENNLELAKSNPVEGNVENDLVLSVNSNGLNCTDKINKDNEDSEETANTFFIDKSNAKDYEKFVNDLNRKNSKMQTTKEYSKSPNKLSNKSLSNSITDSCSSTQASKKNSKYKYRLNACIVHLGNSTGHYVNYRKLANASNSKDPTKNDWYFTSDTIISSCKLEDALKSNAYMLFYERIK